MSPRTKIIIAGAVVTALIGLIVIDLATAPARKPTDERGGRTAATTRPPAAPRRPAPAPIEREVFVLPGPTPTPVQPAPTAPHRPDPFARLDDPIAAPPPPQDLPPPADPGTYTVVSGDSFWKIAAKQLGDANLHGLIAEANPSVDEFSLRPGMKLTIPAKPVRRPMPARGDSSAATARTADPNVQVYVIKRGDVLWNIAKPFARARGLDTGSMVQAIRDANPGLDPERLKLGAEIVIPK